MIFVFLILLVLLAACFVKGVAATLVWMAVLTLAAAGAAVVYGVLMAALVIGIPIEILHAAWKHSTS